MAKAKSWKESGGELGSYLYNIFSGGTKEQAVHAAETSVIVAATVDDASQSKTVSAVTQAVLESGTTDPLEMAKVAVSTATSMGETSDVDAKAVASLLTPEGRAEIKRLVNKAWEQVKERGVKAVISDLFSGLVNWFKEQGTKISKSVGDFFEKVGKKFEEFEKQRDSHATGKTLGEISGRGREEMAPSGVAEYKAAKRTKEVQSSVAAKAAVGKELQKKAENIGVGLKHVGTKDTSKLMQDLRDPKSRQGLTKPKGQSRE